MPAALQISHEAEWDVQRIFDYYEDQRVGLGEQFLEGLDSCYEAIVRMPKAFRKVMGQYRRALVERFPYAVYYHHEESSDRVNIYVVIHTSRDPKAWQERLP